MSGGPKPKQIDTGSAIADLSVLTDGSGRAKIGSTPGASGGGVSGGKTFGSLLDYPFAGSVTVAEVQYVQVRLVAGEVIDRMRCFIDAGASGARNVRQGLYNQSSPTDPAGTPNALVSQTNSENTTGDNGTFKDQNLTDTLVVGGTGSAQAYTVPTTGFYWMALITDSSALKFAVSESHRADFLPVRRQSSSGTDLPATASGLSNPVSALIFQAAMEQ